LIDASERIVRARNAQRAYFEAGSGEPVVLLHGIGARAFSWETQLARWSNAYRVVAWDAPGYGHSDDLPHSEPETAEYADALLDLLDTLAIERPIVVGHSLGALIAGTFAARHPQRLSALVLLSVACGYGHLSFIDRERLFATRAGDLQAMGIAEFAQKRAASIVSPHALPEHIARVRDAMSSIRESGYLAAMRMLTNGDLLAITPNIRVPTLVACGSVDTVTPPEQNRRVAESIPGAAFALVDGAGHAVYVERPDELEACVLPFISSIAKRRS